MGILESKYIQKRDAVNSSIIQKQKLPANSPEIKVVVDQMVLDYKDMRKLKEEYEKKLIIFKYRFPEKSLKQERKYGTLEVKSLEQMEQELGIDGRLNRNTKKIRSQYGETRSTGLESSSHAGLNDESKESQNEHSSNSQGTTQKSIDEEGTILIKK